MAAASSSRPKRSYQSVPKERRIDDSQITRLICVRLRHLLYDFFRVCFGLCDKKKQDGGPKHTPKSHLDTDSMSNLAVV